MNSFRILASLAAFFLVGSVALGSVLPPNEPLSQVIADLDGSVLADVQGFLLQHGGAWVWQGVTVPILVRPSWLIPFALGLVCLGGATSLTWQQRQQSRKRS